MKCTSIRLEPIAHEFYLVIRDSMNILKLSLHFIDFILNTVVMAKVDIILHVRQLGEAAGHHDILSRKQIPGNFDKLLAEHLGHPGLIPPVNTITISEEIIRFHTNITISNKLFGIGSLARTSSAANNNKLSHAYTPKTNK